jgi:L-seryl-tRNA(Ser) seleniumtransferase
LKQFQKLPSVSSILSLLPKNIKLHESFLIILIRGEIEKNRKLLSNNHKELTKKIIIENIIKNVTEKSDFSLKNIINGTGIVLHTGFGRSPFEGKMFRRISNRLNGYVNLEFDLTNGERADRQDHLRKHLSSICKSESALVVNNNAAAVLLSINEIAAKGDVIVSRGQLVEIGGSFRIPDIIEKSGSRLKEVGTTNRTHLSDYVKAINKNTKLILWVHTSNYVVKGFVKSVPLPQLIKLGNKHNIPVMVDWGSGSFIDMKSLKIADELPLDFLMKHDPDLVTFSGDKLIGGPQSGVIIGRKKIIDNIQSNSLYRVLRCDKITIAFMEEILRTFKSSSFSENNITIKMLTNKRSTLKKRGKKIINLLSEEKIEYYNIKLVESYVEAGSGSLPEKRIESMALSFNPHNNNLNNLSKKLRTGKTPVVGYISKNTYFIDLKAVLSHQLKNLANAIESL